MSNYISIGFVTSKNIEYSFLNISKFIKLNQDYITLEYYEDLNDNYNIKEFNVELDYLEALSLLTNYNYSYIKLKICINNYIVPAIFSIDKYENNIGYIFQVEEEVLREHLSNDLDMISKYIVAFMKDFNEYFYYEYAFCDNEVLIEQSLKQVINNNNYSIALYKDEDDNFVTLLNDWNIDGIIKRQLKLEKLYKEKGKLDMEARYLPSIKEVERLQKEFDFQLPDDYVQYMLSCNGEYSSEDITFRAEGLNCDFTIYYLDFFPDDIFNLNNNRYSNENELFFCFGAGLEAQADCQLVFNKKTGTIDLWDRLGYFEEIDEDAEEEPEFLTYYKVADTFLDFMKMAFTKEFYDECYEKMYNRKYSSDFIDDSYEMYTNLQTEAIIDLESYVWHYDIPSEEMQMVEKDIYRQIMSNLHLMVSDSKVEDVKRDKVSIINALNTKKKKLFSKDTQQTKLECLKEEYRLPSKYLNFLESYNGAILENTNNSGYYIEGIDRSVYPSLLFGVFTINKENDLELVNEEISMLKDDRYFIIGEDYTNGYLLIDLDDSNFPVYYWDITNYHRQSNYNSNTYLICNSINEFLNNIDYV